MEDVCILSRIDKGRRVGSNEILISRITSAWNESTVTWNNQPTITIQNQLLLPPSTSSTQDYTNINVTAMVQDMINNPVQSFGFMLQLANEAYYRSVLFASSDHSNPALHPLLQICFDYPTGITENKYPVENFNIYPNPVANQFTIYDGRFTISEIQVIDMFGQLVLSQEPGAKSQKQVIDVSSLSPGIYFVTLKGDKVNLTGKFVKE